MIPLLAIQASRATISFPAFRAKKAMAAITSSASSRRSAIPRQPSWERPLRESPRRSIMGGFFAKMRSEPTRDFRSIRFHPSDDIRDVRGAETELICIEHEGTFHRLAFPDLRAGDLLSCKLPL